MSHSWTQESREKLAAYRTGKRHKPETILKMRRSQRAHAFARKYTARTEEDKAKISLGMKRYWEERKTKEQTP